MNESNKVRPRTVLVNWLVLLQQRWSWYQRQMTHERGGEIRRKGSCKKRSSISIVDQFLRVKDVRKKQRQVVVFLATQSFSLKSKQELFGIFCMHKLNSVRRKCRIYMIPTLDGISLYFSFCYLLVTDQRKTCEIMWNPETAMCHAKNIFIVTFLHRLTF